MNKNLQKSSKLKTFYIIIFMISFFSLVFIYVKYNHKMLIANTLSEYPRYKSIDFYGIIKKVEYSKSAGSYPRLIIAVDTLNNFTEVSGLEYYNNKKSLIMSFRGYTHGKGPYLEKGYAIRKQENNPYISIYKKDIKVCSFFLLENRFFPNPSDVEKKLPHLGIE